MASSAGTPSNLEASANTLKDYLAELHKTAVSVLEKEENRKEIERIQRLPKTENLQLSVDEARLLKVTIRSTNIKNGEQIFDLTQTQFVKACQVYDRLKNGPTTDPGATRNQIIEQETLEADQLHEDVQAIKPMNYGVLRFLRLSIDESANKDEYKTLAATLAEICKFRKAIDNLPHDWEKFGTYRPRQLKDLLDQEPEDALSKPGTSDRGLDMMNTTNALLVFQPGYYPPEPSQDVIS